MKKIRSRITKQFPKLTEESKDLPYDIPNDQTPRNSDLPGTLDGASPVKILKET